MQGLKRSVIFKKIIFLKSLHQNNRVFLERMTVKIRSLQSYEVLWIHVIDSTCMPISVLVRKNELYELLQKPFVSGGATCPIRCPLTSIKAIANDQYSPPKVAKNTNEKTTPYQSPRKMQSFSHSMRRNGKMKPFSYLKCTYRFNQNKPSGA